jgi:hypothetical protein
MPHISYDIGSNAMLAAAPMGQVGLEWTVAGFGDFSGNAGETDMLMRNSNTGAFEVYDISHNAITSAGPSIMFIGTRIGRGAPVALRPERTRFPPIGGG